MSDAHQQLVEALRAVVAQDPEAHALVIHALENAEREKSVRSGQSREEVPGPYAPSAWSMYAARTH
ncbi:hypothetical protein [Methylobacterium oxalidis]|uniref:Uncharacterized protein n=1 Tax=Methylobacterium oxalidis TaxID=944322 RepID=A0A512JDN0_9HYPH|nr:hypothetical protein [Methylobacterium oxalidis]GEP08059.1 hypothetical protein MOX02_60970 [Methylobacterium oxalidis]GJE31313.1 hypothetical protein LDDCCGHA_1490 [Methylobacterium oxalidis]GLS66123.1 hypothetical protein GCM10007888_45050 [Methylobacterium oxalidis]